MNPVCSNCSHSLKSTLWLKITHKQKENLEKPRFQLSLSNCLSRTCSFLASEETIEKDPSWNLFGLLHYVAPICPKFEHHFISYGWISITGELVSITMIDELELCRHAFFFFFSTSVHRWLTERHNQAHFRSQLTDGIQLLLILETENHKWTD